MLGQREAQNVWGAQMVDTDPRQRVHGRLTGGHGVIPGGRVRQLTTEQKRFLSRERAGRV